MTYFTPHRDPSLRLVLLRDDSIIQPGDWMNHTTNPWQRGFGFLPVDSDDHIIGRRIDTTQHYVNNLRFFRPIPHETL